MGEGAELKEEESGVMDQACADMGGLVIEDSPLIDLTGMEGPERAKIGRQIDEACKKWGFFQIMNHGFDTSLMKKAKMLAKEFFKLPEEEKLKHRVTEEFFEGYCCSKLKDSVGKVKLSEATEFLLMFLEINDIKKQQKYWPDSPPGFREVMEEYMLKARVLHEKLLALISETIGLEPDALRKASEGSFGPVRTAARMNFYQPWASDDEPARENALASHTDAGTVITMIYSDEVAGLQINKDGRWVKIEPITDAFIVNLGDILEIMTNGRYKSVEHRGVPDKKLERLSLATAYYPHKESVIGPIPELMDSSNPQIYKVLDFSEYVTTFYREGLNARNQTQYAKIQTAGATSLVKEIRCGKIEGQ